MTVSPQIKLFALVMGVLALCGFGYMTFLGPSSDDLGAVSASELTKQPALSPPPLKLKAKSAKAGAATAKPVVKAKAAAKPGVKAKAKPNPVAPKAVPLPENGLPDAINLALRKHPTVVVELYHPKGKIDPLALGEARAGAVGAGVGFVALNVLFESQVAELTKKLGVALPAPMVLIFRRPDMLVLRIDGFADRATVAQAAQNAAVSP